MEDPSYEELMEGDEKGVIPKQTLNFQAKLNQSSLFLKVNNLTTAGLKKN